MFKACLFCLLQVNKVTFQITVSLFVKPNWNKKKQSKKSLGKKWNWAEKPRDKISNLPTTVFIIQDTTQRALMRTFLWEKPHSVVFLFENVSVRDK